MSPHFEKKSRPSVFRFISTFILIFYVFSAVMPTPAMAQQILNLPAPGSMLPLSDGYFPVMIKGMTIDAENPLKFDFIVDTGDDAVTKENVVKESRKLIKYFMASLTVPEDEMWVNLSPYEKDRIIPQAFGETEMGRDLLSQDYVLKQITASLTKPDTELGQKFWQMIEDASNNDSSKISDLLNKVWIVPQRATVYEHQGSVYVVDSHLKVMMEQDYVAQTNDVGAWRNSSISDSDMPKTSHDSTRIMRETILPKIEQEVNTGKNFTQLRQIYNSLILAAWYKKNLKQTLLGQVYVDKNKIKGVDVEDKDVKTKIYNQYLEAFRKGAYNYIREEYDPATQDIIPKKYFSGGMEMNFAMSVSGDLVEIKGAPATLSGDDSAMIVKGLMPSSSNAMSLRVKGGYKDMGMKSAATKDVEDAVNLQKIDFAMMTPQERSLYVDYLKEVDEYLEREISLDGLEMYKKFFMHKSFKDILSSLGVEQKPHYFSALLTTIKKNASSNDVFITAFPFGSFKVYMENYVRAEKVDSADAVDQFFSKVDIFISLWGSIVINNIADVFDDDLFSDFVTELESYGHDRFESLFKKILIVDGWTVIKQNPLFSKSHIKYFFGDDPDSVYREISKYFEFISKINELPMPKRAFFTKRILGIVIQNAASGSLLSDVMLVFEEGLKHISSRSEVVDLINMFLHDSSADYLIAADTLADVLKRKILEEDNGIKKLLFEPNSTGVFLPEGLQITEAAVVSIMKDQFRIIIGSELVDKITLSWTDSEGLFIKYDEKVVPEILKKIEEFENSFPRMRGTGLPVSPLGLVVAGKHLSILNETIDEKIEQDNKRSDHYTRVRSLLSSLSFIQMFDGFESKEDKEWVSNYLRVQLIDNSILKAFDDKKRGLFFSSFPFSSFDLVRRKSSEVDVKKNFMALLGLWLDIFRFDRLDMINGDQLNLILDKFSLRNGVDNPKDVAFKEMLKVLAEFIGKEFKGFTSKDFTLFSSNLLIKLSGKDGLSVAVLPSATVSEYLDMVGDNVGRKFKYLSSAIITDRIERLVEGGRLNLVKILKAELYYEITPAKELEIIEAFLMEERAWEVFRSKSGKANSKGDAQDRAMKAADMDIYDYYVELVNKESQKFTRSFYLDQRFIDIFHGLPEDGREDYFSTIFHEVQRVREHITTDYIEKFPFKTFEKFVSGGVLLLDDSVEDMNKEVAWRIRAFLYNWNAIVSKKMFDVFDDDVLLKIVARDSEYKQNLDSVSNFNIGEYKSLMRSLSRRTWSAIFHAMGSDTDVSNVTEVIAHQLEGEVFQEKVVDLLSIFLPAETVNDVLVGDFFAKVIGKKLEKQDLVHGNVLIKKQELEDSGFADLIYRSESNEVIESYRQRIKGIVGNVIGDEFELQINGQDDIVVLALQENRPKILQQISNFEQSVPDVSGVEAPVSSNTLALLSEYFDEITDMVYIDRDRRRIKMNESEKTYDFLTSSKFIRMVDKVYAPRSAEVIFQSFQDILFKDRLFRSLSDEKQDIFYLQFPFSVFELVRDKIGLEHSIVNAEALLKLWMNIVNLDMHPLVSESVLYAIFSEMIEVGDEERVTSIFGAPEVGDTAKAQVLYVKFPLFSGDLLRLVVNASDLANGELSVENVSEYLGIVRDTAGKTFTHIKSDILTNGITSSSKKNWGNLLRILRAQLEVADTQEKEAQIVKEFLSGNDNAQLGSEDDELGNDAAMMDSEDDAKRANFIDLIKDESDIIKAFLLDGRFHEVFKELPPSGNIFYYSSLYKEGKDVELMGPRYINEFPFEAFMQFVIGLITSDGGRSDDSQAVSSSVNDFFAMWNVVVASEMEDVFNDDVLQMFLSKFSRKNYNKFIGLIGEIVGIDSWGSANDNLLYSSNHVVASLKGRKTETIVNDIKKYFFFIDSVKKNYSQEVRSFFSKRFLGAILHSVALEADLTDVFSIIDEKLKNVEEYDQILDLLNVFLSKDVAADLMFEDTLIRVMKANLRAEITVQQGLLIEGEEAYGIDADVQTKRKAYEKIKEIISFNQKVLPTDEIGNVIITELKSNSTKYWQAIMDFENRIPELSKDDRSVSPEGLAVANEYIMNLNAAIGIKADGQTLEAYYYRVLRDFVSSSRFIRMIDTIDSKDLKVGVYAFFLLLFDKPAKPIDQKSIDKIQAFVKTFPYSVFELIDEKSLDGDVVSSAGKLLDLWVRLVNTGWNKLLNESVLFGVLDRLPIVSDAPKGDFPHFRNFIDALDKVIYEDISGREASDFPLFSSEVLKLVASTEGLPEGQLPTGSIVEYLGIVGDNNISKGFEHLTPRVIAAGLMNKKPGEERENVLKNIRAQLSIKEVLDEKNELFIINELLLTEAQAAYFIKEEVIRKLALNLLEEPKIDSNGLELIIIFYHHTNILFGVDSVDDHQKAFVNNVILNFLEDLEADFLDMLSGFRLVFSKENIVSKGNGVIFVPGRTEHEDEAREDIDVAIPMIIEKLQAAKDIPPSIDLMGKIARKQDAAMMSSEREALYVAFVDSMQGLSEDVRYFLSDTRFSDLFKELGEDSYQLYYSSLVSGIKEWGVVSGKDVNSFPFEAFRRFVLDFNDSNLEFKDKNKEIEYKVKGFIVTWGKIVVGNISSVFNDEVLNQLLSNFSNIKFNEFIDMLYKIAASPHWDGVNNNPLFSADHIAILLEGGDKESIKDIIEQYLIFIKGYKEDHDGREGPVIFRRALGEILKAAGPDADLSDVFDIIRKKSLYMKRDSQLSGLLNLFLPTEVSDELEIENIFAANMKNNLIRDTVIGRNVLLNESSRHDHGVAPEQKKRNELALERIKKIIGPLAVKNYEIEVDENGNIIISLDLGDRDTILKAIEAYEDKFQESSEVRLLMTPEVLSKASAYVDEVHWIADSISRQGDLTDENKVIINDFLFSTHIIHNIDSLFLKDISLDDLDSFIERLFKNELINSLVDNGLDDFIAGFPYDSMELIHQKSDSEDVVRNALNLIDLWVKIFTNINWRRLISKDALYKLLSSFSDVGRISESERAQFKNMLRILVEVSGRRVNISEVSDVPLFSFDLLKFFVVSQDSTEGHIFSNEFLEYMKIVEEGVGTEFKYVTPRTLGVGLMNRETGEGRWGMLKVLRTRLKFIKPGAQEREILDFMLTEEQVAFFAREERIRGVLIDAFGDLKAYPRGVEPDAFLLVADRRVNSLFSEGGVGYDQINYVNRMVDFILGQYDTYFDKKSYIIDDKSNIILTPEGPRSHKGDDVRNEAEEIVAFLAGYRNRMPTEEQVTLKTEAQMSFPRGIGGLSLEEASVDGAMTAAERLLQIQFMDYSADELRVEIEGILTKGVVTGVIKSLQDRNPLTIDIDYVEGYLELLHDINVQLGFSGIEDVEFGSVQSQASVISGIAQVLELPDGNFLIFFGGSDEESEKSWMHLRKKHLIKVINFLKKKYPAMLVDFLKPIFRSLSNESGKDQQASQAMLGIDKILEIQTGKANFDNLADELGRILTDEVILEWVKHQKSSDASVINIDDVEGYLELIHEINLLLDGVLNLSINLIEHKTSSARDRYTKNHDALDQDFSFLFDHKVSGETKYMGLHLNGTMLSYISSFMRRRYPTMLVSFLKPLIASGDNAMLDSRIVDMLRQNTLSIKDFSELLTILSEEKLKIVLRPASSAWKEISKKLTVTETDSFKIEHVKLALKAILVTLKSMGQPLLKVDLDLYVNPLDELIAHLIASSAEKIQFEMLDAEDAIILYDIFELIGEEYPGEISKIIRELYSGIKEDEQISVALEQVEVQIKSGNRTIMGILNELAPQGDEADDAAGGNAAMLHEDIEKLKELDTWLYHDFTTFLTILSDKHVSLDLLPYVTDYNLFINKIVEGGNLSSISSMHLTELLHTVLFRVKEGNGQDRIKAKKFLSLIFFINRLISVRCSEGSFHFDRLSDFEIVYLKETMLALSPENKLTFGDLIQKLILNTHEGKLIPQRLVDGMKKDGHDSAMITELFRNVLNVDAAVLGVRQKKLSVGSIDLDSAMLDSRIIEIMEKDVLDMRDFSEVLEILAEESLSIEQRLDSSGWREILYKLSGGSGLGKLTVQHIKLAINAILSTLKNMEQPILKEHLDSFVEPLDRLVATMMQASEGNIRLEMIDKVDARKIFEIFTLMNAEPSTNSLDIITALLSFDGADKVYEVLLAVESEIGIPKDLTSQNTGADEAMFGIGKDGLPVGGIDLDPAMLDMQILRDGNGVPFPLELQSDQGMMNVQGFIPIITDIIQIPVSLPLTLGFADDDQVPESEQTQEVYGAVLYDDPKARG